MLLTVDDQIGGHLHPLEVDGALMFTDLLSVIEAVSGHERGNFTVYHNGVEMEVKERPLSELGLCNDDLLIIKRTAKKTAPLSIIADMQKQFVLSQLRQKDPKKAAELERDPAAFTAMMEAEQKRHRILADPTSIEAQQAIEESIRQENVLQNLEAALEANPESFGHIDMLYIRCAVDGHAIDAFVDTGAQATIMTLECAEKCGLHRLLDRRFNGVAKGVGTGVICGRIHSVPVKLGNQFVPCAFTVLEANTGPAMIVGLDTLRRLHAVLDMKQDAMIVNGEVIPFLKSSEIPKDETLKRVNVEHVAEKLVEAVSRCEQAVPRLNFTASQNGRLVSIPHALVVQDALEDEYFVSSIRAGESGPVCNLGLWTSSAHGEQLDTERIPECITADSAVMDTRKRSLVKCINNEKHCVLSYYKQVQSEAEWEKWRSETFRLNSLHHLVGIYEHADTDELEKDGSEDCVPVLHLIQVNTHQQSQPPSCPSVPLGETCVKLKEFLLQVFNGDLRAAEALMMFLVAKPSLRVNGLVDSLFIGKLCLNLRVADSSAIASLLQLLKLLRGRVTGPIEISNANESFNTIPLYPKLNVDSGLLSLSPLQQPDGTVLLIDETGLNAGEFKGQAVQNLQSLIDLIQHQQIPLDFAFQQVLIKVDVPVLIVSLQGKSILPSDLSLPCGQVTLPETNAAEVTQFQDYLAYCRSAVTCHVEESMAAQLEQEYVELRKERGTAFDEQSFHRLINLARLRAVASGSSTLSASCWQETKNLFLPN